MIEPHGGVLINRTMNPGDIPDGAPVLTLNEREKNDLEMIASGAMSPLEGFMTREDYGSVVDDMRLPGGQVWTLPVVFAAKDGDPAVKPGDTVNLAWEGRIIGTMEVADVFTADLMHEAEETLLTTDDAHPGVAYLKSLSGTYIGGRTMALDTRDEEPFREHRLTPAETRALFREKGWKSIVAFQTRNPIHRAHEYLQKVSLELVDGLLVHPLVGATKSDDISAEVRMRCYETILEKYYPADRTALSVFPAAMRYAGPREAVFHAILRKNYGCTHFIVGRDHAGVGDYYGTYDAQEIFDRFSPEEIGIVPMKFEHAFFCNACDGMATARTCPHTADDRVFLSGKKVRVMLQNGELPPPEFTRPEIARLLMEEAGKS
ncbi:MAG TPA: sulfate adenylyltransferase [Candidatus Sabulitectum sp.]|nr:sulfate adenylyltransferase [Candidatus Sabulitectum sp.]HPF32490.1 sulfate adenylyltransferase [Candidatus Sabulitectum sp.]HPJ28362.1 sulfate adenylyltransferase [Candidatus Sabulitectum sp.]HPR21495.1 sulfate adenylyltransferase [Candidatus Sabulitectum sp.]